MQRMLRYIQMNTFCARAATVCSWRRADSPADVCHVRRPSDSERNCHTRTACCMIAKARESLRALAAAKFRPRRNAARVACSTPCVSSEPTESCCADHLDQLRSTRLRCCGA
eukprot:49297-Prymnesium_polylepis.2